MARSRGPLFPELGFLPRRRCRRRRHAGERPAIITAISVSGIFQPFLVSPFAALLRDFILHFDGSATLQRATRENARFPKSRSLENSLYILVAIFTDDNCELRSCATDATQPRVLAARKKNIYIYLPRVRHRKMVRGLFERELCRDKNKNAALATPHRKKKPVLLRIFCPCACMCVRVCTMYTCEGGEKISMRIYI